MFSACGYMNPGACLRRAGRCGAGLAWHMHTHEHVLTPPGALGRGGVCAVGGGRLFCGYRASQGTVLGSARSVRSAHSCAPSETEAGLPWCPRRDTWRGAACPEACPACRVAGCLSGRYPAQCCGWACGLSMSCSHPDCRDRGAGLSRTPASAEGRLCEARGLLFCGTLGGLPPVPGALASQESGFVALPPP